MQCSEVRCSLSWVDRASADQLMSATDGGSTKFPLPRAWDLRAACAVVHRVRRFVMIVLCECEVLAFAFDERVMFRPVSPSSFDHSASHSRGGNDAKEIVNILSDTREGVGKYCGVVGWRRYLKREKE